MGGVVRFVFALIWFAIALGISGNLVDATIASQKLAARAFANKGISAKRWNEQINEPSRK